MHDAVLVMRRMMLLVQEMEQELELLQEQGLLQSLRLVLSIQAQLLYQS